MLAIGCSVCALSCQHSVTAPSSTECGDFPNKMILDYFTGGFPPSWQHSLPFLPFCLLPRLPF